jgi:hypothetical protein
LYREKENLRQDSFIEEDAMKAALVFTGSGPILVLTTYESFAAPGFVEKLEAHEVSIDLAKKKYGQHFDVVMKDVKETDDLRVLDYNGHRVFHNFSFKDLGAPYQHE